MKSLFILLLNCFLYTTAIAQNQFFMSRWTDIKGYWSFDNPNDVWYDSSSFKNPLVVNGVAPIVSSGFFHNDKAIVTPRASPLNFLACTPNLSANGGGSRVNTYTIMFDIKIPNTGSWYSLLQTGASANADDGDLFINTSGKVGIGAIGYSSKSLTPEQWTRIVLVCDNNALSGSWKIYIDGMLDMDMRAQAMDGRFSLPTNETPFFFFADDDNENASLSCSAIAVWDRALSNNEINTMGGYYVEPAFSYPIKPFLQTPTSSSIYISWISNQTTETKVIYGTSQNELHLAKSGSYESISSYTWHTVQLNNLTPHTTYYYRCVSGTDSSAITPFHTPPTANTPGGHVIFGLYSDTHIGSDRNATAVLTSMKNKFIELYGDTWYEKVSCIINNGDVFQNASIDELKTFYSSYITPVSGSVPFMCTMGNHDLYTNPPALYYQFLKYDDFSAFPNDPVLNEKYYSFMLGNTMFITLNSESHRNNTQSTWLENQLIIAQNDPLTDFVFVNSHHPGRSEMWQVANDSWIQNTVYPILGKYSKVAMISHGHSHNYERGVIKSSNADNVDFRTLITGGGGGWLDFWTDYPDATDWAQTHRTLEGSHYSIIDIDMDAKKYTATMYSLGSSNAYNTTAVIADTYHGIRNQARPDQPIAVDPKGISALSPTLTASAFSGVDGVMSSQFQLTSLPGDYTSPIIDNTRDYENIFQSSGYPDYIPIDKNAGIDLQTYQVTTPLLQGATYGWRVRYRDQNLKWSDWSDEATFVVDKVTTISDQGINNSITAFPNPTSDFVEISGDISISTISIYDRFGNRLFLEPVPSNTNRRIDLSMLPQGVYFISITNEKQNVYQKIIKI